MKRKLIGGVGAVALALTLVAGTATAASAEPYVPAPGCGSLDRFTASPGETVTYSAQSGTFQAGEAVAATIEGTGGGDFTTVSTATSTHAFTKNAAADGSLSFVMKVPAGAKNDNILQVGTVASGTPCGVFTLSIVPTATAPAAETGGTSAAGSSSSLAKTGSDIAVMSIGGVAILLVAGGVVLLLVRRRRQPSAADRAA